MQLNGVGSHYHRRVGNETQPWLPVSHPRESVVSDEPPTDPIALVHRRPPRITTMVAAVGVAQAPAHPENAPHGRPSGGWRTGGTAAR